MKASERVSRVAEIRLELERLEESMARLRDRRSEITDPLVVNIATELDGGDRRLYATEKVRDAELRIRLRRIPEHGEIKADFERLIRLASPLRIELEGLYLLRED